MNGNTRIALNLTRRRTPMGVTSAVDRLGQRLRPLHHSDSIKRFRLSSTLVIWCDADGSPRNASWVTMFEILQKLESKEVVTLCVAMVALLVSIGSLIHSITSKSKEARKSAQILFDKSVLDLVELRKEREDYRLEHGDDWGKHKFGTLRVSLNDRRELLLSQSISIVKGYKIYVSDISYIILGAALIEAGRPGEAVRYYEKAVKVASTPIERAWHRRPLGQALLRAGKLEDGRNQLLLSIEELQALKDKPEYDRDHLQSDMADAYRRLIWAGILANFHTYTNEDLKRLEHTISGIVRPESRAANEEALRELKAVLEQKVRA